MSFSAMRTLVTGGAGFVGSHLVDRLVEQGHHVTILDNLSSGFRSNVPLSNAVDFIEGDVRDVPLVERLIAQADACVHLAAVVSVPQCTEHPLESHAVNLTSFVGILDCIARRKGGVIPIAYASSAAVYGDAEALPVSEASPLKPISIYGADKAGCELQAHAFGRSSGVPTFGIRPFNIYGPRQNASSPYSGVISIFVDRLKRGETLTIFGDGKQSRDFIHVSDIVEHFIAALDKASTSAPVCNAATGKETSVVEVAHKLAEILKREAKITFAPARIGDIYRSVADTTRAHAVLGCTARIDIAEGLKFVLEA